MRANYLSLYARFLLFTGYQCANAMLSGAKSLTKEAYNRPSTIMVVLSSADKIKEKFAIYDVASSTLRRVVFITTAGWRRYLV